MNNKFIGLVAKFILVVAGIVLVYVFDPFEVKKKQTLRDTPVTIESMRSIGQFITAEYAGEVISSLQDAALDSNSKIHSKRNFKKRQVIAVARGRVKAGIDFGTFNEKNFRYVKTQRQVYLYGLKPKILYCEINPWFIPERNIKGFEIIAATTSASTPQDLLMVKTSCLNRLWEQAIAHGLVEHARTNAEESLRNFFSILIGEEVTKVTIAE